MLKLVVAVLLLGVLVLGNGWWGYRSGMNDNRPTDYPAFLVGTIIIALGFGGVMAGVTGFLDRWEPQGMLIAAGIWFLFALSEGIGRMLGWRRRDAQQREADLPCEPTA